jgi:outer membrane protein OmpA-like peptidoglycan-associated protein
MSSSDEKTHFKAWQDTTATSEEELLLELRRLILGPAQAEINALRERLDNPKLRSRELAQVLPEAIVHRSSNDTQLSTALAPTLEEGIRRAIKKDRKAFAEVLFPVIGPAIRRAIAETLRAMLQSLNQVLEHSFSWQGLQWRLESLRSGRPFSEVVLLHSLVYRVEQVFLIHRETGLLLQHAVVDHGETRDADMVSGMLNAIQDFMKDSFETTEQDSLGTIQAGELTVWIENGPQATLASVIRGNPPEGLRWVFQETLSSIHVEQSEALEAFQGDTASFDAVRPLLEACLQTEYKPRRKGVPLALSATVGLLAIALAGVAGVYIRNQLRWDKYLEMLRNEPGIVVTNSGRVDGKYVVAGLRDELARDPAVLLEKAKIERDELVYAWVPFQSLDESFVLERARRILEPPESVSLRLVNHVLILEGSAPHQWILQARKWAPAVAGVTRLQDDNLVDSDSVEFDSLKTQIDKQSLRFELNSFNLVPGEMAKLGSLLDWMGKLQTLSGRLQYRLRIEVIGHSDSTGPEGRNLMLSRARADQLVSLLVAKGAPRQILVAKGVGATQLLHKETTEEARQLNRRVSFKVVLQPSAE